MVCWQSLHSVGVVTILSYPYCDYAMPFNLFVWWCSVTPFFCLFWSVSFLLYVIWFCQIHFAYNITWLLCAVVFYIIFHGVCVMRIIGYILVGVLFFYICTTIYVSIFYSPCSIYSCGVFIFLPSYILYTYFLVHITPGFTFSQLCEIYPWLDENFWGCMHMCFTICSYMCIFEICLHDINYNIWYH